MEHAPDEWVNSLDTPAVAYDTEANPDQSDTQLEPVEYFDSESWELSLADQASIDIPEKTAEE